MQKLNDLRMKVQTLPNGAAVIQRFPIRNPAWDFQADQNEFVAFDSDLSDNRKDPWNRPLPSLLSHHEPRENELTHWTAGTTVAGQVVFMTILND